jgi:[ribosomal protein S5]-alanine N-acetyltransferase
MVEIATTRLRLRPAHDADEAPMHAIMSHPAAMRYWSTPPHEDLNRTREWLGAMIDIPDGEGEDFIVEHRGQVIGKAGLFRFPEVGFILHPDHWGRGFAGEALRAVLDRAFAVHGLGRIVADVDPRNVASLRLLASLGFEETGRRKRTWLVGEEYCDSVDLALTPAAWNTARKVAPPPPRILRDPSVS